jgi:mRNA interferase HigB
MHIISIKKLRDFWKEHPTSERPLRAWYTITSKQEFGSYQEVKKVFSSADRVRNFTIFDVGGNNFRIIAAIHYNRKKVFIREVFTHAQYDKWNKSEEKKKQLKKKR